MNKIVSQILVLGVVGLAAIGCAHKPAAQTNVGPKLYVMNCGTIDIADISVFRPGQNIGEHKRFTDSCYLIVHPKGTLMWDTGLPDALAEKPAGVTMGVFTVSVQKPLLPQLKAIGYPPQDIDYVAFSHMHMDHAGNANAFARSKLIMQEEEYRAAFGPEPSKYRFDPNSYSNLKASPVKLLTGDYDLFGDGTVVIRRAPGHTPGHQALFLKLAKTGNILLSGDLVHFTDNWLEKRVPSFNYDKEQSLKTMQDTEKFLKDHHATLWIQHDLEQNQNIKHAPEYYE